MNCRPHFYFFLYIDRFETEEEAIAIANAASVGLAGMPFFQINTLLRFFIRFSVKGVTIFNEMTDIMSRSIFFSLLQLFLQTSFFFHSVPLFLHGRIFLLPRSSSDLESCRAAGSWNGWCKRRHSLLSGESFWWGKAVWLRTGRFEVWH